VELSATLETLYRTESGRLRATLLRRVRDLDLAEEIVHESFAAALAQWPVEGVPGNPVAWLQRCARNKAIDGVRHRAMVASKLAGQDTSEPATDDPDEDPRAIDDDVLRLVFTCCHPALALDAQVALTLQTVCGLRTEELARAFLVPVATISQRLLRAKKKIREARIPYRVPEPEQLAERRRAVEGVIYLVFTEGYAATEGENLVRAELCVEAQRLSSLLRRVLPLDPETEGLHALLLLHDARRSTRVDAEGVPVRLEEQARGRWDHARIAEGCAIVQRAFALGSPGPYAIQAAIAALHAAAPTAAATDWAQIEELYAALAEQAPGPMVSLNHAVAVAMAQGPQAGLDLLDALAPEPALGRHHLYHAARADLLRRLGLLAASRAAYDRALALVINPAERRFLLRRVEGLEKPP
jgi:RNA polymerase sigma-70 factor (ECF subfamily)